MLILSNYESNKLDNIESTLEKNVGSLVQKYENIDFFKAISELNEEGKKDRSRQIHSTVEKIQNIVSFLKLKLDLLRSKRMGDIKDFENFKREMVETQESIMNLKKNLKSELQALTSLENDLNDDLCIYYNEKAHDWGQSINISNLEYVPTKIKIKHNGQCKEVKQFFDYVYQSGGHENGWRKEDHLLFLKMRQKYKNIEDVVFNLHETLPDISEEEIRSHEEWYQKYTYLQTKKKEAIHKWRQTKNGSHIGKKELKKDGDNFQRSTKEEAKNLREKLSQWKIEKQEKHLVETKIEKQRMLDKIEKERIKKQKQIEIKKIVNEWRESKIELAQSKEHKQRIYEEQERKKRSAYANKLIKQFQSMDELYILKMRQIHKKLNEKPQKRVQSGPPAPRDPNRLLKPTAQWTHRVKAFQETSHMPLPLFATPKLAIPEWRKSIL